MMKSLLVLFLLCEVSHVRASGVVHCQPCRDYNGQMHQCNQWVRRATSLCNTCYCNQGRYSHCKDDLCAPLKACRGYDGQNYPSGQWVRKATTACNTCYCNEGIYTNCKDDLCSKTCKSYLGQIYQEGQYVEKATGPCNACYCSKGQFTNCRDIQCSVDLCKHGECELSRTCKNYLGQIYQEGQYVEKATSHCTSCYCSKGQFINCRENQCPADRCKDGPCKLQLTCKNYLGQVVQNGKNVQQSSIACHHCVCRDGQLINCQPASCDKPLTCRDEYGKIHNNGAWVAQALGDCNSCRCRNGKFVDCTNYGCQVRQKV